MKKDNSRHIVTYQKIGKNVRKYRKNKGYSQEELSFLISSARNYIGCIERGEKFPSVAVIKDIANALGCELYELCDDRL